jgi:hypothetical protein
MSASLKNGLMLAGVVVILVLCGFFYSRGRKETSYPKTGFETEWMCDKCGKHFLLSPAQVDEWSKSRDKVRRDPKAADPRQTVFWCPDCKTFSVLRATVDDVTKIWYIERDSQGVVRELPPEVKKAMEEPPPK